MKILYIHQYFKTPEEGGAIRSYYLAKTLVENGHDVIMLTAHNHHKMVEKHIDKIHVIYLPVYYDNKLGFWGRVFSFLKFIWLSIKKIQKISKIDVCYCTSTPLTVGLIALWLKYKKNIPFYFEVRDLWPEAPIQMGVIKNPLIIFFLKKLELELYVKAERLIALSPGIKEGINKVVPGKAVSLLPNMSDIDFFSKKINSKRAYQKFGSDLKKSFNIAYIGAIGKVNRMESILLAAKSCQDANLKVNFLIAGYGKELENLKKKSEKLKLKNLFFLGHLNKFDIKDLLSISQATYISFCNLPVLGTNSPNKFFDSLAAGKICIVNVEGWIKQLIEENSCGFYTNPDIENDFVYKLKPYLQNKQLLKEAQKNAYELAQLFSRENTCKNFLRLFDPELNLEMAISSVYTLRA